MATRIKVRFNGQTLVPQEPVDLPEDADLEALVSLPSEQRSFDRVAFKRAVGAFLEMVRNEPPLEGDDLPADLAEQHDHYLYGTPKRS